MNIRDIRPVNAKKAKTKDSQKVAFFLGITLGALGLIQFLFIGGLISALHNTFWGMTYSDASALAATIVVLEILAVPFLLRLKLSHGFRSASMIVGWLVILIWLVVSAWAWLSPGADGLVQQVALLGGLLPIMAGPWVVLFALMLGVAMAWASWGLWPLDVFVSKGEKKKNSKV